MAYLPLPLLLPNTSPPPHPRLFVRFFLMVSQSPLLRFITWPDYKGKWNQLQYIINRRAPLGFICSICNNMIYSNCFHAWLKTHTDSWKRYMNAMEVQRLSVRLDRKRGGKRRRKRESRVCMVLEILEITCIVMSFINRQRKTTWGKTTLLKPTLPLWFVGYNFQ